MSRNAFPRLEREYNEREDSIANAVAIARASMRTKTPVTWVPVSDEYPDAELTVLVNIEGGDEPVWFGFTDGKRWMDACSGAEFAGRVAYWAELPMGVTK